MYEITKRDFIQYRGYLQKNGLSSDAIKFKQSVVSSLNNYIENIIVGDDSRYDTFRNFTRGLPFLSNNIVYEKVNVSKEEYEYMMDQLKKDKDFMGMTWLAIAFNVGARRSEIIQFKSEIIDYDFGKNTYIMSNKVRAKGEGKEGKVLQYMVNKETIKHIKNWLDVRDYEHEYIFTTKRGDKYIVVSRNWANYFCTNKLSPILGRRINPHILKSACVTNYLE